MTEESPLTPDGWVDVLALTASDVVMLRGIARNAWDGGDASYLSDLADRIESILNSKETL